MSPPSDATDPVPDPPEPPRPPERPRRLFSPGFWVGIGFGLICILVGLFVAIFGARLFPARTVAPPPASATVQAAAATPAPARGGTNFDPSPGALPPAVPLPEPASQPEPVEVAAFTARLDRIEAAHRASVNAAAAALAVSIVADASAGSGPFAREVDALIRLAPASPDLQALRDLAVVGAPSRGVLVSEFEAVAGKAATASRAPTEVEGPLSRVAGALAALVTIRRVNRLSGSSPDAVLARAERRVNDGDFQAALTELRALPPSGRQAVAAWSADAERRLAVERRIAAIRARALADLMRTERQGAG